jgi:hypothetical protein
VADAKAVGPKEAEALIIGRAWKDEAFKREFLGNPKATIEKYSSQKLPENVKVFAHESNENEIHFVIPKKPASVSDELSDADLEKVAGGEFVIGIAILGAITAVATAGVSVANDQTRSRGGW